VIGVILQTTTDRAVEIGTQLLGLAVLAGTLAAVAALGYRLVARERVSTALTLLVGLSGVALYLNTTTALGQAIGGDMVAAETGVALFNIGAFLAGAVGATVGTRAGDRFATEVLLDTGTSDVDEEVNRLVRTVGRVTTVTLPEEVEDVVGYDPVAEATKEKLAGKKFVFPQNLTVAELQGRLASRLRADYGVGTVDVDLTADGEVEYLAVGARAAGIGPTLPPATNAVAIRADPAFSASTGDVVQVWETDPMRRVLTAELRGVAGDIATIAIDAADTPKLDPRQRYRLVTLPVEDRPDREFAALLREADETFSTVAVAADSPLDGMPVGALDLAVVAIKPEEEQAPPVALPDDDQVLGPGDVVFAVALPEALRHLEADDGGEASAEPSGAAGDDNPDASTPSFDDDVGTSFDELKSAFESGDAEWADEEGETTDDLVDLEDAEISFDESDSGTGSSEDGEPTGEGHSEDDDSGENDDSDEDGDDDDDEGGGGKSFAQLKEEFESGEADWEDDVSDSPGGDMRLDE